MIDVVESDRLIARSRERFLAGEPVETGGVRGLIVSSWRRCRVLGLPSERLKPPYNDDLDLDSALMRAAEPVLDRLDAMVAGTWASVTLADAKGVLLRRRAGDLGLTRAIEELNCGVGFTVAEWAAGTTGVGMALMERRPCHVFGFEHFAGSLGGDACVSVPIRDPLSGRIAGVVDFSCPPRDMKPAIGGLLRKAALAIERRLLDQSTEREQALLRAYQRGRYQMRIPEARPESPSPVDLRLLDGTALGPRDMRVLRNTAAMLIASGRKDAAEVPLSEGRLATLLAQPVAALFEGVAVEVRVHERPRSSRSNTLVLPAHGDSPQSFAAVSEASPAGRATPEAIGRTRTEVFPVPGDAETDAETPVHPFPLAVGEPGVSTFAVAARRRLELLWEASTGIGTTLDVARTAEELAGSVVPAFADLVTVDLHDWVLSGAEPVATGRRMRRAAIVGLREDVPCCPAGEEISFGLTTPQAKCLTSGWPTLEQDLKAASCYWSAFPVSPKELLAPALRSAIAVPIRARGVVLGVASFYRAETAAPFEDDDISLAGELVTHAATCIDNARRYAHEHSTAVALQRSLLPQRPPTQSVVETAFRYLPAGAGDDVGGDWFDVIPLSGARVALVVGDVVGHGIQASATMGRLRTGVRTLADVDLPPDELLTHLDDVLIGLSAEATADLGHETTGDVGATCLYAVYDPVSRNCALARAGHPPPALVTPDGAAHLLDLPAGPPLGLGGLPFETAEFQLPVGSVLALYTNGLVGARGYNVDDRLDALCHTLARPADSLDAACDAVITALLPDCPDDDIALLLARTRALGAEQIATWDIPPDPAAVAGARRNASDQVIRWGLGDFAGTTELVVSELVTNAIRYGLPPIQLRLIHDYRLICEVSDTSGTTPRLRRARVFDEDGRGLLLVAQHSRRWGTRHWRHGKTIWAEQALPRGQQR